MYKQAIVFRKDLKISKGKMIVQACHASLGSFLETDKKIREKWIKEGSKKIVLSVPTLEELLSLVEKTKKMKIPKFLVKDAGLTQVKQGTVTCFAIGPEREGKINKITEKLKLL